ncbi:hypothetical protein OS493_019421 [Desmophyllum pertusum]|uniref:Uncharacterized protein n=1 Tax=Desmophyllum pertusum TaxID=174260 RepID=A0A9X0DAV1_9CNID|nr:hypothetical protein OS493_019421 [Desmophyllum pertusum]
MADSGNAARKRDLDQNHFILHGYRCTELKSNNNSFHIHCPCDICSGKAVPPTTAWRHRETTKRAKLTTDDHEEGDDQGLCNSISVDSAVEFSASYSEQQMTGLGNLTNADPLLLGDDDGNMMLSDDYDQGGGEEAAADEETCSETKLATDDGFYFAVGNRTIPLRGAVSVFCGGTPAAQLAGGFKEGVSFALKCCRHCEANQEG